MIQMTEPKLLSRDGKLHYSLTINGKRVRKSLNLNDTVKNRNLVNNKIFPQLKSDVHNGVFFDIAIPTVNDYSILSFDNHSLERREITTHDYKNMYKRHIEPYFGNVILTDIKVSDINQWKNLLFHEKKLSSKRVNEIKKVFGTILNDAVQDELINYNPISKSKPLPTYTAKDIEPFSLDEISTILNSCEGQVRNIISLLFFSGVRTGECIGLMWSDVSFDSRTIHIQRTIGRGIIGPPKTRTSIRLIDISDKLFDVLKNQYQITGENGTYVFLNKIGNHYFDSSKLRDRMWKNTLEKANIRYRTIYQTRHTFCSLNLQAGEDILWISKTMGHSSPKTTLEKYSKFVPRKTKKSSIFDILIVK